MNKSLQGLFQTLIEKIVVPEIAAVIRKHQTDNGGQLPTDAEIIAKLPADVAAGNAVAAAFLAATEGQ